jgi:hypothetical protein
MPSLVGSNALFGGWRDAIALNEYSAQQVSNCDDRANDACSESDLKKPTEKR